MANWYAVLALELVALERAVGELLDHLVGRLRAQHERPVLALLGEGVGAGDSSSVRVTLTAGSLERVRSTLAGAGLASTQRRRLLPPDSRPRGGHGAACAEGVREDPGLPLRLVGVGVDPEELLGVLGLERVAIGHRP